MTTREHTVEVKDKENKNLGTVGLESVTLAQKVECIYQRLARVSDICDSAKTLTIVNRIGGLTLQYLRL